MNKTTLADCAGGSPCTNCKDKRQCGKTGCIRQPEFIRQGRASMNKSIDGLHADILNLRPYDGSPTLRGEAYRDGFKDAVNDAAELVAALLASPAPAVQPELFYLATHEKVTPTEDNEPRVLKAEHLDAYRQAGWKIDPAPIPACPKCGEVNATAQAAPAVPAGDAEIRKRVARLIELHADDQADHFNKELNELVAALSAPQTAVQGEAIACCCVEFSSRVCERGTKSCTVRHQPAAQSREQPQPVHSTGALPPFAVSVGTLKASNGTSYIVCIRRTDLDEVPRPWDPEGCITPYESDDLEHAEHEAQAWADFLRVPFASDTAAGAQKPKGPELDAAPLPDLTDERQQFLEDSLKHGLAGAVERYRATAAPLPVGDADRADAVLVARSAASGDYRVVTERWAATHAVIPLRERLSAPQGGQQQ